MSLAVQNEHGPALRQAGASGEASFILGGQIAGQPQGLFLIYPQGNAIAATPETPYLQIGESKYGKTGPGPASRIPACRWMTGRGSAWSRCEGTARSNLTVGPPFEVAICPRDQLALSHRLKLEDGVARASRRSAEVGHESLRQAFDALPRFRWELGSTQSQGGPQA